MTPRLLAAGLASTLIAAGTAIVSAQLASAPPATQLSPTADWATHAQNEYAVIPNVTYLTANGFEAKLDVYRRRDVQAPQPTLVFYHGVLFANAAFDELIPAGGKVSIVLPKEESRPQPVGCHIHPWMSACLLIRDNPYFGVSNDKGELTIPHIPEGKHTFVVWQEKKGLVDRGSQDGKRFDWKRGRMEVTIAGDTDLGTFEIPLDKTR